MRPVGNCVVIPDEGDFPPCDRVAFGDSERRGRSASKLVDDEKWTVAEWEEEKWRLNGGTGVKGVKGVKGGEGGGGELAGGGNGRKRLSELLKAFRCGRADSGAFRLA
jgi:hypothetical protein